MNSWVWASTPVVTRTSTRGRRAGGVIPSGLATRISRAISSNESSTMCPTPAWTARVSSARDLLLPCRVISSGATPAASATSSSPPVHTSTPRPSSLTQRSTALEQNALAA